MDFYSMLLARKLKKESGGDVTIESLVVTENGKYSETGKAYSPVVVNIPFPENGYLLKSASGQAINISDGAPLYLQECSAEIIAVQEGSEDPSPTNIRPIIGQTEVVIDDVGKNLIGGLDFAEAFSNSVDYTLDTTNKVFTFRRSDIGDLIIYDQFKPNTRYTLFISAYANLGTNRNSSLRVEYTDGTIYYFDIQTTTKSLYTYTTTSGKSVKRLYLSSFLDSTVYAYYDECGIFEGVLTVDDFEPYKGKTYTIQLGDTIYGGELDVVTGELTVTHGEVDLGDLTWLKENTSKTGRYRFHSGTLPSDSLATADTINCIADSFTADTVNHVYSVVNDNSIGCASVVVYITSSVYDSYSANDFKSAMVGKHIVYELATPYTIQLTPQQIRLLEGTNNLSCNAGDLNIEYLGKGVN